MAKPDPRNRLISHCRKIGEQHQEGLINTDEAVIRLIETFFAFADSQQEGE